MRRIVAYAAIMLGAALFAPSIGERDRSESAAIGAIRAVVSAQKAYAAETGGYYDTLECLAMASCVAGIRKDQKPYLDPLLAGARRTGVYRIEFHPGPEAERGAGKGVSPTAMTRFAIVAVPVAAGAGPGRAFCGDDSGSIYFTSGGRVPRVAAGRCLDREHPLR